MIHTVHIDDSTTNGKRLMQELRKQAEGVVIDEIDKVAETQVGYMTSSEFSKEADKRVEKIYKERSSTYNVPDGYMTSADFKRETKKDLDKLCKKYGLL